MKVESLDLYALKYFFDTVEEGSLSRAAELNFVTGSAISQAITRLENWAGFMLTTHEKKLFKLTPAGEIFYRKMRQSYAGFKASLEAQYRDERKMRVGCSASLADVFLFPALRKLKPINDLHLVTGTSKQLTQDLENKVVHLAILLESTQKLSRNSAAIHSGSFILAQGKKDSVTQIITTEHRPEVAYLKSHPAIRKKPISYLAVESWTLALKLAIELDCACLIPDFLLNDKLRKVEIKKFRFPYQVVVKHQDQVQMSELEVNLLQSLLFHKAKP